MLEMRYSAHIVDMLIKLYRKQKARVKVAGTISGEFRVRRGVRQGCVLSPSLFNILAEMVMRVACCYGWFRGRTVIGQKESKQSEIRRRRYSDSLFTEYAITAQLKKYGGIMV